MHAGLIVHYGHLTPARQVQCLKVAAPGIAVTGLRNGRIK